MAAYRRVYDSRHLQADCQEPGSTLPFLSYRNAVRQTLGATPMRGGGPGVSDRRLDGTTQPQQPSPSEPSDAAVRRASPPSLTLLRTLTPSLSAVVAAVAASAAATAALSSPS